MLGKENSKFFEGSRLATRNGKPVAVVIAVENKAQAERLASRQKRTLCSVFEQAEASIAAAGTIPEEDFWREVETETKSRTRSSP